MSELLEGFSLIKKKSELGANNACNPSYSGGKNQEDRSLNPAN
jgi:hypothetical protein